MKRNQPKVEQVEMNEIATKASRVAESRTACLIDESLRIARNNNQDPFRTVAISAYLQGVQDALTPPAEPSGNTGELPVCETCRGTKRVKPPAHMSMPFLPCPDCSAAQPATEQPRIWRCIEPRIGKCRTTHDEALAREAAELYRAQLQYSTDNGKTWVDEQAMEATEAATQEPGESAGSLSGKQR